LESRSINPPVVRFATFEVDLRSGELRKGGVKLKLGGQPFQVLAILLEQSGAVVTRDELQKRLWPDTFVDVDHNLNTAINKIREVLGDSAENPRFVETLPRRGYRFIASIEGVGTGSKLVAIASADAPAPRRWRKRTGAFLSGGLLLLAGVGVLLYKGRHVPASPKQRTLTRITLDDGLQIEPTWSADGRYIAYSSDRGGKFDIWVQQVSGGDPVQVTKGPGQHWQPDWSPDGKYIAYRSEEGEGGIYVVPALGGVGLARKIAPFGYRPRWSPNSSQVLFQTYFTAPAHWNRFFIGQLDGSAPREVLGDFITQNKLSAGSAAWHPDGKRVTVWVGDISASPSFWTVPIAGGPGIQLEVSSDVARKLAEASGEGESADQLGDFSFSWAISGDAIYFERGYRGARNVWKMAVDSKSLRATAIERLTTGPGPDAGAAISPDGKRMAFTAKSQRIRTWLFPFDAAAGQIRGVGKAITSPGRLSVEPTMSRDGTNVAYVAPHGERDGPTVGDVRNEVWVKPLPDGEEFPVAADPHSRWSQHWSLDGMELAYERRNHGTDERQIVVWSSQSREESPVTTLSPNSLGPDDWSPDGKVFVCSGEGIWLLPVSGAPHAETAARKITAPVPAYKIYQPHFSPDSQWIVFEAVANSPNPESSLYVLPASGGPWTRVIDDKRWNDKPRWGPDGKTIYFVSGRGGFFNVWGIRFDATAGKTIGQPFQVSKFESAKLMIPRWIMPVGMSLTQDKLALTMAEESGGIWLLENVDR
jgi:Tol biopolymer transport system component/DNA-binding winged helix-turn-helix (wHTH) protein